MKTLSIIFLSGLILFSTVTIVHAKSCYIPIRIHRLFSNVPVSIDTLKPSVFSVDIPYDSVSSVSMDTSLSLNVSRDIDKIFPYQLSIRVLQHKMGFYDN